MSAAQRTPSGSTARSSRAPLPLPDRWAVLAATAFVGVALLEPRLGPNLALVDPLLVVLLLSGVRLLLAGRGGPAADCLARTAPWIGLIALATLLSLYDAGLPSWAVVNVAQTAYSLALFFGAYALMWWRRSAVTLLAVGLAVGVVMTTVTLALTLEPGVRPSGAFYHPNYAGHYLVLGAIGCWYGLPWSWARRATLATAATGVVLTASFGALLMALVFLACIAAPTLRARPWWVLYGAAALVTVLWVGSTVASQVTLRDVAVTQTLSAERLDRSQAGRLTVWSESVAAAEGRPFGVGPDGLHNRGLINDAAREPHNLFVAFYAERGLLGLLGLLGLGVALWRHAPSGSTSRVLLLTLASGNLVRETLHYRHMWLVLALVLVLDHARGERPRPWLSAAAARELPPSRPGAPRTPPRPLSPSRR